MKHIKQFMLVSMLLYIGIALSMAIYIQRMENKQDHAYRVDINRYMHAMKDITEFPDNKLDITMFGNLVDVTFLETNADRKTYEQFFAMDSKKNIAIIPWYQGEEHKGYLKFYYRLNENVISLHFAMQISLILMEGFILAVLWFIKKRIMEPFQALCDMPEQLASGHFKDSVYVQKNGFFNHFLWGMSQLKDALEVSRKRQFMLEKEKKEMLLSLSHDIKTPLNLIKLYNKALAENLYGDEASRHLAMHQIEQKSIDIESYVNAIMKTSREEILDFDVSNDEFYLKDLIIRLQKTYISACTSRHIRFTIHPYENCLMKGDIDRYQEIFDNLFENAFKYGDGRFIEIIFDEEDGHQLIHFFNSGEALHEQEYAHLFDSFYRGANSEGILGSGLGLYICKALMRKMHGTIYVQKQRDGIEFVLVLA